LPYYNKWYPQQNKVVPIDIKFTPLTLAVWFADDGYMRCTNSHRLQVKFSTHGFDLPSVEIICSHLCDRYSEYFGITLEGDRKKPIIYGSDSAARAFALEIDEHLPPSMDRKATWRKPEACFYQNIPIRAKASIWLRKTKNGIRDDSPSKISTHATSSLF
jgi:hypothetical protein